MVGEVAMSVREAVHRDPVWRDRSNFIIATPIDPSDTDISSEQLWARKVDDKHFEVCCIPFFAYDLALGDVVEVDSSYMVQRVSMPSGRYVFRVHFDESMLRNCEETVERLTEMGALLERSSSSLLAVDAQDAAHAHKVADYLVERENLGRLIYETGQS